jgi:hypothetical protein
MILHKLYDWYTGKETRSHFARLTITCVQPNMVKCAVGEPTQRPDNAYVCLDEIPAITEADGSAKCAQFGLSFNYENQGCEKPTVATSHGLPQNIETQIKGYCAKVFPAIITRKAIA